MRKNYFFFVNDNIYIDIIIFNSCFFLRLALYQLNRFNVISTNVKKAIQKVRWHSDEKADYSDSSFLKHLCVHSFRYINSSLPHLPYFLFFTSLPPAKRKKNVILSELVLRFCALVNCCRISFSLEIYSFVCAEFGGAIILMIRNERKKYFFATNLTSIQVKKKTQKINAFFCCCCKELSKKAKKSFC